MIATFELTDEQYQQLVKDVADEVVARGEQKPKKPLTPTQFAEKTGISRSTVYRMMDACLIERVPDIGDRKLIPASELDRFTQTSRQREHNSSS